MLAPSVKGPFFSIPQEPLASRRQKWLLMMLFRLLSAIMPDMLKAMEAKRGVQIMNKMASRGMPFFFMVDAWARYWVVCEISEAADLGYRWNFGRTGCSSDSRPIKREFQFGFEAVDFTRYASGFRIVRKGQLRGETWLSNLTFPSKLFTDLSLEEMFLSADAEFRLYIPDKMTVFSPERFIRISPKGCISSYPMKGTIRGDKPGAEIAILQDAKENAEHVTIVDLIRNDIGMVADRVKVPRFRYITEIAARGVPLLQVSSEITGELGLDWKSRVGTILSTMLPAGSVTGAPKKRTCEIIREAERHERGWYAGVFGCFNGRELDSAVSIRFVRKDRNGHLYYHSGGGITINSDLHREYVELKEKIYVPIS